MLRLQSSNKKQTNSEVVDIAVAVAILTLVAVMAVEAVNNVDQFVDVGPAADSFVLLISAFCKRRWL